MRRFAIFTLALFVTLGMSDIAEAKKDKKKKKKGGEETTEQMTEATDSEGSGEEMTEEAAEEEAEELVIEMTGVADIDDIFTKANAPIESLRDARMKIENISPSLIQALGLTEGTPFSDALSDLMEKAEGKINLAISEQGVPSLEPSDAVPENVSSAIDAVNQGVSDATAAIAELSEIPAQIQEVIAAAQSFNPKSLIDSGVKPLEAPKLMKTIASNLKVLGQVKDEPEAVVSAMTQLTDDLKSAFSSEG